MKIANGVAVLLLVDRRHMPVELLSTHYLLGIIMNRYYLDWLKHPVECIASKVLTLTIKMLLALGLMSSICFVMWYSLVIGKRWVCVPIWDLLVIGKQRGCVNVILAYWSLRIQCIWNSDITTNYFVNVIQWRVIMSYNCYINGIDCCSDILGMFCNAFIFSQFLIGWK